jgi:redox-sensitive bicupin YhaK (pirin superfamily)
MRRTVGPFIFFDEMGPAAFPPGEGINVRPHPHIGLSTVTYLFDGVILHRDSLGFVQAIEPGAVNLMTAGSGIVHSERSPAELDRAGQRLHGIQTWMALPEAEQEIDPDFRHFPKEVLPVIDGDGWTATVILGDVQGTRSPVTVPVQTLYLELRLEQDATAGLPGGVAEQAIYVVSGEIEIDGHTLRSGEMAVLRPGAARLTAGRSSRVMVIGGEAIGHRHIWWNFVHTSEQRIDEAAALWRDGGFDRVPGDDESIPLPRS